MENLFGSLDFCPCSECRSVLSPAAYLVDLLEFLRKSGVNEKLKTPLDVLIGDGTLAGRRPDLAALPLTCENTNTVIPYIDLVNEILEFAIAHNGLDASAAYDTGTASADDLRAEPQHILPDVYTTNLRSAVYPPSLPFDLWIETVRGFFNYFKLPLARVLEVLRADDDLELFVPASAAAPYNRAQILAEALGLSPIEYQHLTVQDTANWFQLYGYVDGPTALNGQPDPTDPSRYIIPPLASAKNLAQRLGVTYQELADLVTTGFVNPKLYPLIFPFQRFGISMDDAFRYTGQSGYVALTGQAKTDFEALLDGITTRYKAIDSGTTFEARTWLTNLLPANYALGVLALRDPSAGCDFAATTLEYADGASATPATPLDFLKLNLFVRLWKKLGWTMDETDRALQLFFPAIASKWGDATFAADFGTAWQTALVYLAHLDDITTQVSPALGRAGLLPLWSTLPTAGANPLYAQLFLTPSVLNNDPFFDDPAGQFPAMPSDPLKQPLSAHQTSVQGALGLTADDVIAILADAVAEVTTTSATVNGQPVSVPAFSLTNLSICYRYSVLSKCLQLSIPDLIALKRLARLNPFQPVGSTPIQSLNQDVLYTQSLAFLQQVTAIQGSGFTVADLQYLLRHRFDPIGPYQTDQNALLALVQAVAVGVGQIQAQHAAPADVMDLAADLIEQRLSGLMPTPILKALFAVLTGAQTAQASQGGVAPASQIDPAPYVQELAITFIYDASTQTQTVTYTGLLLDWKKAELLAINNAPLVATLLDAVQQQAQQQAHDAFLQSAENLLGVWASLVEYEAVQTGAGPTGLPADALRQQDPAVRLNYNEADQLQWLGYRGALTDTKKGALLAALSQVNPPPTPALTNTLSQLLDDVQQQAMPAYRELVGALLAMWANTQTYQMVQAGVAPGSQIDPTMFAAYPELQLTYDATTQVQTLTYHGVLTDATRSQLAALIATSAALATLLQAVRDQAVQWFQSQAANLLTATAADLDAFSQPYLGVDIAQQQRRVKAELVKVFLPLLADKLSRQLIAQTLAANLGASPSMTESLLTDAGLLSDPNRPGKSLLGSFLTVAQAGVTVVYYASLDGSGNALATGTATTVDTAAAVTIAADPAHPYAYAGSGSAHFEGYLQVPADGPYRFFAVLGDAGAQVAFQIDSPDPTALFTNPILPQRPASASNDEIGGIVQLKGGIAYHFSVDATHLDTSGVRILIQGETLPKEPLSQITLYPRDAVASFARARTLLSKVVQIVQGVGGLDEREVGYLTANATQFNGLDLSALPTQASDDTPDKAANLCAWFLTLVDYADLRKGPAGGSDGLIDVFEQVGQVFTEPPDATKDAAAPWKRLADLTRRDPQVVRDLARSLNLIQEPPLGGTPSQVAAAPDFGTPKGIRRLWQVLQLVQLTGLSLRALIDATAIVAPAPAGSPQAQKLPSIAANLKNAVKARYTVESWRPIAQSVFDPLRRRKRDALMAYLVNDLGLENAGQLFEYFLVDPGMEPVVQTSRIRLALSSIQTFIQRCLLSLETGNSGHPERNVAPIAINHDWWAWMKRYRVWQANREIFLFPENWMEPELRLDASDLFQALESAVLQGDVTRDLVEDAFYSYLQGLEARARLDVVAMYLDQPTRQETTQPGPGTLHVIGRTFGLPHQYFYRTYAAGAWSAWEVVTANVEGDHLVAVIWRQRLNLFWLTFSTKSQLPPAGDPTKSTSVASLTLGDLAAQVSAASLSQVQVQLHWSEYFQGKWSSPITTGLTLLDFIKVGGDFDPRTQVYVHVTKEIDQDGEHAVLVYLDFKDVTESTKVVVRTQQGQVFQSGVSFDAEHSDVYISFRVTSKNGDPDWTLVDGSATPFMPYDNASGIAATLHTGVSVLEAKYDTDLDPTDGTSTSITKTILQAARNYALLTCANPVVPPFLDPAGPAFYQEAGGLVSPFFFKDTSNPNTSDESTFFVQPSLTETPIPLWEGWAVPSGSTAWWTYDPSRWIPPQVQPQLPTLPPGFGPDPAPIDPAAIYTMQPGIDQIINAGTGVTFGETVIGALGGITGAEVGRLTILGTQGLSPAQLQSVLATQSLHGINLAGNLAGNLASNLAGLNQQSR